MTREAWIVFDLGFGDAGKGATVDFLVRDRGAGLVVRYNGGAQAGHNVIAPDGTHHTFAQFGSGLLVAGVRSVLGPDFVLHPGAMLLEEQALQSKGVRDAFERSFVDSRALVISPFQQAAGRLRELARGKAAHGTCGVGIGETVGDSVAGCEDTIRVSELASAREKLRSQQLRIRQSFDTARDLDDPRVESEWQLLDDEGAVDLIDDLWRQLAGRLQVVSDDRVRDEIARTEVVVYEGAQGALLDKDHGFHPHTTWGDCTPRGAFGLLDGAAAEIHRLGVIRCYMVRHGPGPFPTYDPDWSRVHREPHNAAKGWQGEFRVGAIDCVLLRYALAFCGGADGLVVNCLDRLDAEVRLCDSHCLDEQLMDDLPLPTAGDLGAQERLGKYLAKVRPVPQKVVPEELLDAVADRIYVPVWLTSTGATARDRRWMRAPG